MQKKISIFSFFAGIGILDLAFEKSGYNIVFVNEYDDLFMASYQYARTQMTHLVPLYGYHNDSAERYAKKRGKRKLINLVAKEREKGNLVGFIGGPPCPDFSVAGKNAGVVGENGRLTKVYFDIICRCRPDFFLFENVKGLVKTEKHRAFYNEMMMKVQANGYIIDEKVLNALAYGVPQFRERVFMVGIQKGIYQNPPDALSFAWDKYALFETADILRRDWPKQREFAVDSPYEFSFERIPKRLTVEYWFNKNDVEDHPNGNAFGKRMGHLLFKLSVDQNLMGNILAADIEIDPDQLRKARVRCVKEVKETNGEISFEDTVRYQKGAE